MTPHTHTHTHITSHTDMGKTRIFYDMVHSYEAMRMIVIDCKVKKAYRCVTGVTKEGRSERGER